MIVAIKKTCLSIFLLIGVFSALLNFTSCTRQLGYGILLWSADDPSIPSGTVLPVFIRSNIDQVWVAGIPEEYRVESSLDKFEIPLPKLELAGNRKEALRRAEEFAPYALSYAETLQDGLPIRENPDNGARRVYRLKIGEIIKILEPVGGVDAVGTTGDPLPGEWYKVLTENGTVGFCFSYRLRVFEHTGGSLAAVFFDDGPVEDPELEMIFSRAWPSDVYSGMVNARRLNLEELRQNWHFDPGQDTGIARLRTKEVERNFSYTSIRSTGRRSWRFEGTTLQMELRADNILAVQYIENGGIFRTFLFSSLPTSIGDLIIQESARRDQLYNVIFRQGPVFSSYNYGTISFASNGTFTWTGNDLLMPQVIPAAASGSGTVEMRLFLAPSMSSYTGAFSFRFNGISGAASMVNFLYTTEAQGFRLEYVPDTSLDGNMVMRRATSPLVLYFFKAEPQILTEN